MNHTNTTDSDRTSHRMAVVRPLHGRKLSESSRSSTVRPSRPNSSRHRGKRDVSAPQLRRHLLTQGLSDNTVYQYCCMWERWERWAQAHGHPAGFPEPEPVRAWSQTLPTGVSTRDTAKAAIKHWCELAGLEDVSDAVERPEKNTRQVGRQLTRQEARQLLTAAADAGERGYAIYLGLFAGMRISEMAPLKWEHHNIAAQTLTFWREKNDGWHTIALHPILANLAAPYVATGGGWCFPGRNQGHLGTAALRNSIRSIVKAAGLPVKGPTKITPHALRRTAGRAIYEAAEYDVTVAQQLLGHAKITTTQRYIGATYERTRKALDSVDYGAA